MTASTTATATTSRPEATDHVWSLLDYAGPFIPRALLYGPPGTGKTYIAQRAGVRKGQNVYRFNCTEDTPAAEARGQWMPHGSEFVWHDGPAMMAFRNGGRLVVDEITRATDDLLSFMLALLDGSPITLPNGETVHPSPGMSVWATTNDTPEDLTDALADRFTVKVLCDEVNPAALETLPSSLARAVRDESSGVSLRQAQEFLARRGDVGDEIAARLIWESRAQDVLYAIQLAEKMSA